MTHHPSNGFTLMEFLAALVIIGLLATLGLPRVVPIVERFNAESLQHTLLSHLHLARSESVRSGSRTVICPSNTMLTCIPTADWSQGWLIYTDINVNSTLDAGTDPIIRTHQVNSSKSIFWSKATPIIYEGDGSVTDTSSGSFVICDAASTTASPRGINVHLSGRARTDNTITCP